MTSVQIIANKLDTIQTQLGEVYLLVKKIEGITPRKIKAPSNKRNVWAETAGILSAKKAKNMLAQVQQLRMSANKRTESAAGYYQK